MQLICRSDYLLQLRSRWCCTRVSSYLKGCWDRRVRSVVPEREKIQRKRDIWGNRRKTYSLGLDLGICGKLIQLNLGRWGVALYVWARPWFLRILPLVLDTCSDFKSTHCERSPLPGIVYTILCTRWKICRVGERREDAIQGRQWCNRSRVEYFVVVHQHADVWLVVKLQARNSLQYENIYLTDFKRDLSRLRIWFLQANP